MPTPIVLRYRDRPSTIAFMLRAAWPTRLRAKGRFPDIAAVWNDHPVSVGELASFERLTGLVAHDRLPLMLPQVLGFPLQMVILTHPALPWPIWGALQVRAHMAQHRPISCDEPLELACRVAGDRFLERGAELDLYSTVHVEGELRWESLTTFYYRHALGGSDSLSPLAASPRVNGPPTHHWRAPRGGGVAFGRLSGDYNGIHLSDHYARRHGFARALLHPPVMLGQACARLPEVRDAAVGRLDVWMKGPVPYGETVALRSAGEGGRLEFTLTVGEETRPALVGRWNAGPCSPLAVRAGPAITAD